MNSDSFCEALHRVVFKDEHIESLSLEELLEQIPRVDSLDDIPPGAPILLRFDLDVPTDKNSYVTDLARIEAGARTVKHCHEKRWKTILFGHVGRDSRNSAEGICRAMSDYLDLPIQFVPDWVEAGSWKLTSEFVQLVREAKPGSVFILENTRKYAIETALWRIEKEQFPTVCETVYRLCEDIRQRLSTVEVNEAIAASNLDVSSAAVPLVMSRTALGFYIAEELRTHIPGARKADLVVFSGLKINKLDDLEGILNRGKVRVILAAGSLALALLKGQRQLAGADFFLGLAETDPEYAAYIGPQWIDLGRRIAEKCQAQGVELILPTDFVLDTGEVRKDIPRGRAQMDIGPESRSTFAEAVSAYVEDAAGSQVADHAVFYNGVFGKFEDPRFEEGTRDFIRLLRKITQAGIPTYVGGGEGRKALHKYGSIQDVTHAFTCGGTVLKALGTRQVPYLKAMYAQNVHVETFSSRWPL